MKSGELFSGDVFVLCSDGLTGHVEPDELKQCVVDGATQSACDELIELALQRGGHDNVTVIVVRYSPDQNQAIVPREKLRG
ncbi:MAG: PP2C family protein-serine/threonine phosphatase [Gammaproteobacteria bacterium]